MAQKTTKIDDIKSPDKVAPSTSSRPILVANHTMLQSDPMMVPNAQASEDTKPDETVSRTAKTIKPTGSVELAAAEKSTESTEASPEPAEPAVEASDPNDAPRDAQAEATAAETAAADAQAAREQELEGLIAAGSYVVPINAVQRKRSRIYVMLLCIVAVLLAVVLLDALLDAGIIKLSHAVPHTHFFRNS